MSQNKDFVLFDEPDTPVLASSHSFRQHRSPAQSPYIDAHGQLPATLDEKGSPQRKRQRSEMAASPVIGRAPLGDPQSGSLGSPMHDLSLRDTFPHSQTSAAPFSNGMTSSQQERVKDQIREDLADVDTRAFTGPLRDILQKHDYTPKPDDYHTSPLASSSDPMQAGVAPSFNLFSDYDAGEQSQSGPSSTPNHSHQRSVSAGGQDEDMPFLSSQRSTDSIRTRSSTYDPGFGSVPRNSQNVLPDWAMQSQANQSSREPSSQQSQSSKERPVMPPPSQNLSQGQLTYRGGPVSMEGQKAQPDPQLQGRRPLQRESSGLTVSPQQAFKDYDDVENAMNYSKLGNMPSLFASAPPGLSDTKHTDQTTSQPRNTANPTANSESTPLSEDVSSAAHRVPLSRADTLKQQHYQKRPGPTVYQGDRRASASQESGSQNSLFSPADSGETISTDDDEDERPYNPSGVRPSMLRGGPSSLYLNFPAKGAAPLSPNLQRPAQAKETGTAANGAWSHVKSEAWSARPTHMNHPRFSDVSASSSDSEDDRGQRKDLRQKYADPFQPVRSERPPLPHHKSSSEDVDDTLEPSQRYPHYATNLSRANMPGALGGYGYLPGSQESGLSVMPGTPAGKFSMKRDDTGLTGSQDESHSPSIRSSAQVIDRKPHPTATQHSASNNQTKAKPAAPPALRQEGSATQSDKTEGTEEEEDEEEEEEEGEEGEEEHDEVDLGSDEESEYDANDGDGGSSSSKKRRRQSSKAGDTVSKQSVRSRPVMTKPGITPFGSTKCDYTSPVTGATCQTAFHRPYDLARHRETIHAREEAGFIREGKLKLSDCVVLGKEVDPKKSMAVVEWKCKTCAASFSRKDAMLRHERLRHNAPK